MNRALFWRSAMTVKTPVLFLVPARAMIWGLDLSTDLSSSRKACPCFG